MRLPAGGAGLAVFAGVGRAHAQLPGRLPPDGEPKALGGLPIGPLVQRERRRPAFGGHDARDAGPAIRV